VKFALALLIAVHFWGERNVHVPCHPQAVSGADALVGTDIYGNPNAMAATTGCRILISSLMPAQRSLMPDWYCATVVHEVGHLAGLSHTETGIMSPTQSWEDIPWDCEHWKHFARAHGIHVKNARIVL
jgi:hypothetical protein